VKASAPLPTLVVAAALALGAAISLGLARFSYALLLPPMRADLGWSYFTAGAMNTVNAAGYLAGALAAPAALRRFGARGVFLGGAVLTALALFAHGLVLADGSLYVLRFVTGVGSAGTFVAGGLLAARLVVAPAAGDGPRGSKGGSGCVSVPSTSSTKVRSSRTMKRPLSALAKLSRPAGSAFSCVR